MRRAALCSLLSILTVVVLAPAAGFATAPPIDILVVPSAEGSMDADLLVIDWPPSAAEMPAVIITDASTPE